MFAVRALPRPIAVVLALMLALILAVPLMGAKWGNSANAKACQKGGHAALATNEDPYTAFANQDACVSYAAQGGVLTSLVVVHGSAEFVWVEAQQRCAFLFDATVPADMRSDVTVNLANSSSSGYTAFPTTYPAYGSLLVPAGVTMTSAAGRYYPSSLGPFTSFPVTVDHEPCGPGSSATDS